MERGFLSPKPGMKDASVPRVDGDVLADNGNKGVTTGMPQQPMQAVSGNAVQDDIGKSSANSGSKTAPTLSYASLFQSKHSFKSVNLCELRNEERVEGAHVTIPMKEINDVSARFVNTLYGYFIGKRLAFPIVENYVKNTWAKYGLERVMLNNGFFLFQFSTKDGMEKVLESGPWLIRSMPIFLNVWSPNTTLAKEEVTSAPVWLKLHNVPIVAYTEVGLSLITTQIGKPIMLDSYTSSLCIKSWGQNSYARALVEVSSLEALMDHVMVAIPFPNGLGHSLVRVGIEYEWKPPRCASCKIFDHNDAACPKNVKQQSVRNNVDADGFVDVTKRKGKGKEQTHEKVIDGVRFTKPKVTLNYRWQPVSKRKAGSSGASSSNTNMDPSVPKDVYKDAHANASGPNVRATPDIPVNQVKGGVHTPSKYIHDDLSDIINKNPFGALRDEVISSDFGNEVVSSNGAQSGQAMEIDSDHEVDEAIEVDKPITPIVEKIDQLEKLLIDGVAKLVDDSGKPVPEGVGPKKGNPFSKVGNVVVSDSENEVDDYLSSAGGYNELEGYLSDDYAAQVLDLPEQLKAFNQMSDFKVQGRSRK